jgi:hypothetical protein
MHAVNRQKRLKSEQVVQDIIYAVRDIFAVRSFPQDGNLDNILLTSGVVLSDPWGNDISVYANAGYSDSAAGLDISKPYFTIAFGGLAADNCAYLATSFGRDAFHVSINDQDANAPGSTGAGLCSLPANTVGLYYYK